MRYVRLLPLAALALAVACSDTATDPTSVGRPLFSVAPNTYGTGALTNTSIAALPSGGHLQSGSVFCVVDASLNIHCSTADYFINGVGNTDATATLNVRGVRSPDGVLASLIVAVLAKEPAWHPVTLSTEWTTLAEDPGAPTSGPADYGVEVN